MDLSVLKEKLRDYQNNNKPTDLSEKSISVYSSNFNKFFFRNFAISERIKKFYTKNLRKIKKFLNGLKKNTARGYVFSLIKFMNVFGVDNKIIRFYVKKWHQMS